MLAFDKNLLEMPLSIEAVQSFCPEMMEIVLLQAEKYGKDWFALRPREEFARDLSLHVRAFVMGDKINPVTSKSHLAHAGVCLMYLNYLDKKKIIGVEVIKSG